MPFQIIRDDITRVRADAIVNTANPEPVFADGTDHAIYMAAGARQLLAERRKIGTLQTGEVAVTPAFDLPAKYILHTVGPAWWDGEQGEYEDLASCYRKSLRLAMQLGCRSIAFPLISTGVYGFPKAQALQIALRTISDFLDEYEMDVTLVVFNKEAFDLSEDLVSHVRQFIDEHYVQERYAQEYEQMPWRRDIPGRREKDQGLPGQNKPRSRSPFGSRQGRSFSQPARESACESAERLEAVPVFEADEMAEAAPVFEADEMAEAAPVFEAEVQEFSGSFAAASRPAGRRLSDLMEQVGETFQERLFRLIDERGLTDAQVYKKANIDRKLFSKIRCEKTYTPRKRTVFALAVSLRLNLDETVDLLGRAGLAMSPSSKEDLIVRYCIENGIYDIFEINALLFEYDQSLLGC